MPVSQFHWLLHHFADDGHPRHAASREVVERMRDAPKFVFSRDVINFIDAHFDDYEDALRAAVRAGHTELPHNPMLVEWDRKRADGTPFRLFWLVQGGTGGHYQLSSAVLDRAGPAVLDGYLPIEVKGDRWRPGRFTGDIRDDDEFLPGFERGAWAAIFYAMTLHVRGIVTLPARPVDPKLDLARAKKHLPPVTKDYVTVHIGYVTDRHGNRHEYIEGGGGHVRVHLRRGHTRNQACGPGLLEHKEIWIPPVLVNYRPGVTVADADYLVVP